MAISPARPDSGFVFVRTDLDPSLEIPARVEYVVDTTLATTLGRQGVSVGTVEHLLAALFGLGIDNARIEVDGPEVPIMDGSAEPFVRMILSGGGTVAQRSRPKRFVVIRKSVTVGDDVRHATLEPCSCFCVDCSIDFSHPLVTRQRFELEFSDRSFSKEISRARTFGFAKDVEAMQKSGFALGGSLENAVVIDDFCVRNPDGLRYPDEFVRHKILDVLGDLSLLGGPIVGKYVGTKAGHTLNAQLVEKLLSTPKAFEILEFRHRREAEGSDIRLPELAAGRLAAV